MALMDLVLRAERSLRRLRVTRHQLDLAAELVTRRYPELRTESLGERVGLTDALARPIEVTAHGVEAGFVNQGHVADESVAPELGHRRIERRPPLGGRRRPEQLAPQPAWSSRP